MRRNLNNALKEKNAPYLHFPSRGFGLIGLVNPVPAQEHFPLLPPEKKAVSTEIPGLVSGAGQRALQYSQIRSLQKREPRCTIKRLERLLEDPDFKPDATAIAENDTTVDVIAGDTVITTVTQDDAKLASLDTGVELSRKELAERYADKLKEVLLELKTKQTVTELC
ncbi:MAG: hypothetical protein R3D26_21190 [Cyanobacteriota/Melainabacteria group bacterium]